MSEFHYHANTVNGDIFQAKNLHVHIPEPHQLFFDKNIFIHFYGDKLSKLYNFNSKYQYDKVLESYYLSTRYAILLSLDYAIIPTSDIVQSQYLYNSIDLLNEFIICDLLFFCGSENSEANIDLFLSERRQLYGKTGFYEKYNESDVSDVLNKTSANWKKKNISTTKEIIYNWKKLIRVTSDSIDLNNHFQKLIYYSKNEGIATSKYLDDLYKIPQKIAGYPFLWDTVEYLNALTFDVSKYSKYNFEYTLAYYWLRSHIEEYNSSIISDIPNLGRMDFNLKYEYPQLCIDLCRICNILKSFNLYNLINSLSNIDLIRLRNNENFIIFKNTVLTANYLFLKGSVFRFKEVDDSYIQKYILNPKHNKTKPIDKIFSIVNYILEKNNL